MIQQKTCAGGARMTDDDAATSVKDLRFLLIWARIYLITRAFSIHAIILICP